MTDLKCLYLTGQATKILHVEFPAIKIIALTSYDSFLFVREYDRVETHPIVRTYSQRN
jgi:hypothetical protein